MENTLLLLWNVTSSESLLELLPLHSYWILVQLLHQRLKWFNRRFELSVLSIYDVASGDNIFGFDATDAATSLNEAFAPAISAGIPWAAVLGNHDQESTLSREGVMKHIVGLKNTLSKLNPPEVHAIDGFGNYNLEIHGVEGSGFENKSVLNLYFLDSGDYSTVPSIPGYGWIKPSQQLWFERTSMRLQVLSIPSYHVYALSRT